MTLVSNGGAFGGKEDLSIQGQVALMAMLTGRPVKATLTREESIRLHPKRHPMTLTYTVGCDADGHLTALRARIVGDKGAFASVGTKVLERAAGHAAGPYKVPAVDIEALAVYTNNLPCGAMRGFGANQAAFAIESMLDILAERAGIDAWEIRWRNAVDAGDTFCTGQVLERRRRAEADAARREGRLLRVAAAPASPAASRTSASATACPKPARPSSRSARRRAWSSTPGSPRWARASTPPWSSACATITGIDPRLVRTEVDTDYATPCGMTTASRATVLGGRAVQEPPRKLRAELRPRRDARDLAGRRYAGEPSRRRHDARSAPTSTGRGRT